MKVFITPAGTSIAGGKMGVAESEDDYARRIDERVRKSWIGRENDRAFLVQIAAETNGLVKMGCGADDRVCLLASDTTDGQVCARRLAALIHDKLGAEADVRVIQGLRFSDGEAFRKEGLRNLLTELNRLKFNFHKPPHVRLFVNATGGFKATLPFVVLHAMFHGFDSSYVFDGSDALIRLPSVPLAFDWRRLGCMAPVVMTMNSAGGEISRKEWDALLPGGYWPNKDELDVLFEFFGSKVGLSPVGLLFGDTIEAKTYSAHVFLSARAKAAMAAADHATLDAFETMLSRVRDPALRAVSGHNDPLHNSDQVVWKLWRGPRPTMTYWLERDDIFVGELFTTHNAYDHFWQNEPRSQDDYDPEAFVEYAAGTIDYVAISDEWNDEIAARAKEVEEFEARRTEQRKAESEWTARRAAELTAAREQGRTEKLRESNALQRKLEEERRGHQDRVEELCGRVTALEAELAALKGPPTSEQPMLAT